MIAILMIMYIIKSIKNTLIIKFDVSLLLRSPSVKIYACCLFIHPNYCMRESECTYNNDLVDVFLRIWWKSIEQFSLQPYIHTDTHTYKHTYFVKYPFEIRNSKTNIYTKTSKLSSFQSTKLTIRMFRVFICQFYTIAHVKR